MKKEREKGRNGSIARLALTAALAAAFALTFVCFAWAAPDDSGNTFFYSHETDGGSVTLECTKLGNDPDKLRVSITDGEGDIVIPGTIEGESGTVYTVSVLGFGQEPDETGDLRTVNYAVPKPVAEKISSITVPDGLREITGNLFSWEEFRSSGLNEDYIDVNYQNKGYNIHDILNTDALTGNIPAYISENYEDGAFYAGSCLVRVDPSYSGDFEVKDGTVCVLAAAFAGCESIDDVTLPDSVEYIGAYAFTNSSVSSVNIPAGFDIRNAQFTSATGGGGYVIEAMTFWGCEDLVSVNIQAKKIYSIGPFAFWNCSSLEEIDLSKVSRIYAGAFARAFAKGYEADLSGILSLDWAAFANAGLSAVDFSGSEIDALPPHCFLYCDDLGSISWGPKLIRLREEVFMGCGSLTGDVLGQEDCALEYIGVRSFAATGMTEVTIPETVRSVSPGAFGHNPQLLTLNLNSPKLSVSGYLFTVLSDNYSLPERGVYTEPTYMDPKDMGQVVMYSNGQATIPERNGQTMIETLNINSMPGSGNYSDYFRQQPYLETVNVNCEWTQIQNGAFHGCKALKEINFKYPEKIEKVGRYAFADCGFEEATIYGHVSYDGYAYLECLELKSVTLEGDMESLPDNYMFTSCRAIESFEATGALENIPSGFFMDTSLSEFKLAKPETLKSVGSNAFLRCKLEEVTLYPGVSYGLNAYSGNEALKSVVAEGDFDTLPYGIMWQCPNIESFEATGALKGFSNYCFADTKLSSIVLADPDSLETVGDGAFKGCDLEEAVIMKDVTYGNYVFGFNEKLEKAVVEDGVELIPAYCFEGCTALRQIAIPDSVKTVGWASFKNAGDDLTVYLPRGLELIEDEAFGKQGDGEQRFRIVLTGDPEIETYHVCGYYTKKSTYALDGFAVYRLYTEGGPNLSAYKNGANWFPGDVRPLPSVITFEAPDQEVTAGEAPDPSFVKITVDGTELGEGDFTIDFDTSDLTPGERTVDVLLGDYEAEEYLVASELSAAFGGREASGTVYGFIPAEDLVMTVNVLKKDEPQPGEPLLGDVNLDGLVDSRDLTALARHVSGIALITDEQALLNADVNADSAVTAGDLTKLARYVAGIIDTL